jgi:hypothetical protein
MRDWPATHGGATHLGGDVWTGRLMSRDWPAIGGASHVLRNTYGTRTVATTSPGPRAGSAIRVKRRMSPAYDDLSLRSYWCSLPEERAGPSAFFDSFEHGFSFERMSAMMPIGSGISTASYTSLAQPTAQVALSAETLGSAFVGAPRNSGFIPSSTRPPAWYDEVAARLRHLLSLRPDWDSYGADEIAPNAAARALELLSRLLGEQSRPPDIVPSPDGGLQLEWHLPTADLEIEIPPFGEMEAWYRDSQVADEVEFRFRPESANFGRLRRLYEVVDKNLPVAA